MIAKHEHRAFLMRIARRVMVERGLAPDFPAPALAEAERMRNPVADGDVRDLRELPWCSIDNVESRDLDQLTVAAPPEGTSVRILVAVADVSAAVEPGSAIDDHAGTNTTSVYTPPATFPMLPDRLSSDLTSLVQDQDRLAVVIETVVDADGHPESSSVHRARVRNHAKLAYPGVAAWLEGGTAPPALDLVPGLAENLRLQDQVARRLKQRRHEEGALELDSLEAKTQFDGDAVADMRTDPRNRARDLIEDFMIAANGAIARFLERRGFPHLRRVLRTPARWNRIQDLARELGEELPDEPDARALNRFLLRRRAEDPERYPDLSLSVVKLLGNGEYVATGPGLPAAPHFALAVRQYTHSTAPNRRYPDLVTQRLVRAALAGRDVPYRPDQLEALATHCTRKEDDVQKVERMMRKAAAACLLSGRVGERFDGIVTGASAKGTWARIFAPPVEGRIEQHAEGLDVGDRVAVRLVHVDPERGHIDFARIEHRPAGRRR
jgi:exoribonuclease-2